MVKKVLNSIELTFWRAVIPLLSRSEGLRTFIHKMSTLGQRLDWRAFTQKAVEIWQRPQWQAVGQKLVSIGQKFNLPKFTQKIVLSWQSKQLQRGIILGVIVCCFGIATGILAYMISILLA